MMISPEMFVELHKDKKYKDLLPVRDELINAIRAFETKIYDPKMDSICPAPEVIYQMHLQYLGKLCEIISENITKSMFGARKMILNSRNGIIVIKDR